MTSSTSSSETSSSSEASAGPVAGTANSIRSGLLIILIAALVLGPAVLLVGAFTASAEKKAGDVFGIQRIRSVNDSMDYMARHPGPTVLVFGSSLVNEGFSPRAFDRQAEQLLGSDITSFNIGMGNMKPSYQLLLANRLKDAHERANRKAALAVIELTPFLLTERRNAFRPFMNEQVTSVLMTHEELLDVLWEDPERFARLATIKYLRDGISAEAITGGLRYIISAAQSQAPQLANMDPDQLALLQEQRRLQEQLNRIIAAEQPATRKSIVWNPATQGGLIDVDDLSAEGREVVAELTRKLQDHRTLARDARERVECCDIRELVFNPAMVEEFIAIVDTFKQFTERVEIVIMPANHPLTAPSAEGLARQHALIADISRRTGINVLNYQGHPDFAGNDFYDATHLSMDNGKPRFSALLARDLADELVSVIKPAAKNHSSAVASQDGTDHGKPGKIALRSGG